MAPERYAGLTLRPTGPELLSERDMARIVGKVLGRPVLPVNLPFFMFSKVARQQGVNPLEISGMRLSAEDMKRGAFEMDGGVTTVVEGVTGRPAESFETTARRYAAMPFARVSVGARIAALVKLMMVPFTPGYDLDEWEQQKGFPMPPNPSFSIDDPRWRDEHHDLMTGLKSAPPRIEPSFRSEGATA